MGIRSLLKQAAKSVLGRGEPSSPRSGGPAPVASPQRPEAATPAPKPAAPTAPPAAPPSSPPPAAATPAAPAAPARPARATGGARRGAAPVVLPDAPDADGFRAIAPSEKVPPGKAGTFPLPAGATGAGIVAIFRHEGRLYCIDNACTHEDGPVGEGETEGCRVKCPYHDWEFDFTTGACTNDPERPLATYAVREHDGFLWVGPKLTEGTLSRGGEHNDGMETIVR
jgi:nitrite reductase/ring-hydroxylating ferredoxin subunit